MSILNSIFGQIGRNVDVGNMAQKLGIEPAVAEQAIAALAHAHQQEGDTLANASGRTGLNASVLGQIVEHIGGEGSLGEFARALHDHPQAAGVFGLLDGDGDGNPLNDLGGMAKGLFDRT
jgi:hypothetical protein